MNNNRQTRTEALYPLKDRHGKKTGVYIPQAELNDGSRCTNCKVILRQESASRLCWLCNRRN